MIQLLQFYADQLGMRVFLDWKPERATGGAKRLASRSPKRNGREEMSEESDTGHRIRVVIDGIRKLCVCLPG